MKNWILFSLVLLILLSCKKEPGEVNYRIRFTTDEIVLKNGRKAADSTHTGFGDYITSITPHSFTALIWSVGYIDTVMVPTSNAANMLQYIDQNPDHLPMTDSSRIVNFSGNVTINFNPVIFGQVNKDNQFEKPHIDFQYFYFLPNQLNQEFSLPSAYRGVSLNAFAPGAVTDTVVKVNHIPLMTPILPAAQLSNGLSFIFGNTQTTSVLNPNGEFVALSEDMPIIYPGTSGLVIRSDKYSNMIYDAPDHGETAVMDGTLSFNTTDLIQVYAGADNVPYTSDDVFVYAPNFWERIYSKLEIK